MQSGYVQGSRWGLKGTEDLGGGLSALFQLENGFNLNNGKLGQGGLEFGRQAFVGLSDAKYGTVTLGRQYDSLVDFLAPTTANGNWAGYLFSHPYDNDNTDNTFRVNNTIKYASPTIAGFQFGGTYSFSNDTNFAKNRCASPSSHSSSTRRSGAPSTSACERFRRSNARTNLRGSAPGISSTGPSSRIVPASLLRAALGAYFFSLEGGA